VEEGYDIFGAVLWAVSVQVIRWNGGLTSPNILFHIIAAMYPLIWLLIVDANSW